MPILSKKKKREINSINYTQQILDEFYHDPHSPGDTPISFVHYPPDTWREDEILIFDALTRIEDKLKQHIVELIEGKRKWTDDV